MSTMINKVVTPLAHDIWLTLRQKACHADVFRTPFGIQMDLLEITQVYPKIFDVMNGEDEASTLSFYYDKNPTTGYYEFRGEEEELDMADLLEIDLAICETGETIEEKQARTQKEKTNKDVADFLLMLDEFSGETTSESSGSPVLSKAERKANKKARRANVIHQRNISCV